jgi:crossover junction endodeoxyribonuclease RuvC
MILGVDPGLSGALAAVSEDGKLLWVEDMPVVDKEVSSTMLGVFLRPYVPSITTVAIEKVASMPGQGVATMFKFGKGYGQVLGVLDTLQLVCVHPTPSQWKRDMGLNADKERSRAAAHQQWPSQTDLFKLKKHADRAEAALLALWWVRKQGQSPTIPPGIAANYAEELPPVRKGQVLRRR